MENKPFENCVEGLMEKINQLAIYVNNLRFPSVRP